MHGMALTPTVLYLCVQHVLVKHGPWFVENYGSLSVWSCQGMEKSHHAAKAATQGHTQHGGTAARTSVIVQQYEWWYRCIQHRYTRKEQKRLAESRAIPVDPSAIAAAARRRDAWWASGAAEALGAWRSSRHRDGNRWVATDSGSTELAHSELDSASIDDIPCGISRGAAKTPRTQPVREENSQATTDTEWENEHVTDITEL